MPPEQSDSPNPQYDFILKDQQKPAATGPKFNLSGGGKGRLILFGLTGLFLVALVVVISSLVLGGGKGTFDKLIKIDARAQEISRISTLVSQQSKDSDAVGLAVSVQAALSSQQNDINAYLKTNHVKVPPAMLAVYTDKTVDASLTAAQQNNSLESTYYTYLKTQLIAYAGQLKAAYPELGANGKTILKSASDSVVTLLVYPQLAKG